MDDSVLRSIDVNSERQLKLIRSSPGDFQIVSIPLGPNEKSVVLGRYSALEFALIDFDLISSRLTRPVAKVS